MTEKRKEYMREYRKRKEVKERQAIRFKKWYQSSGKEKLSVKRKAMAQAYYEKYIVSYRDKHPERIKAVGIVNDHIRRNKLSRPKQCEVCHCEGRIQGHHDNYKEPLKVLWVCCSCHRKIHTTNNQA